MSIFLSGMSRDLAIFVFIEVTAASNFLFPLLTLLDDGSEPDLIGDIPITESTLPTDCDLALCNILEFC